MTDFEEYSSRDIEFEKSICSEINASPISNNVLGMHFEYYKEINAARLPLLAPIIL